MGFYGNFNTIANSPDFYLWSKQDLQLYYNLMLAFLPPKTRHQGMSMWHSFAANTNVDSTKHSTNLSKRMDHKYKHKHFSFPLASEVVYMAQVHASLTFISRRSTFLS